MNKLLLDLSSRILEKYREVVPGEYAELTKHEKQEIITRIYELLAEYNTSKYLLADCEYELQNMQREYNLKMITRKTELMQEGMKSTEAKEQCKKEYESDFEDIYAKEHDIALLKANIHNIEYQLRLKFIQYNSEK